MHLCLSLVERKLLVQKLQHQQGTGEALTVRVHVTHVVSFLEYLI